MSDADFDPNQDRLAMYFRYYFYLIPGKKTNPEYVRGEKIIYAYSEEEARKQFEEIFNVEAGTLIKRENW